MPIRPIDMQVALPRVSEIKEAKPNFLNKEDLSRNGANTAMQKESLKQQESVMEMNSSNKARIDKRNKKNKRDSKKQKKKDDENKDGKKQSLDGTYHSIDIKI